MVKLTRREAALLGLAAVTSIPIASTAGVNSGKAGGESLRHDLLKYVDPELRAFLRAAPPETTMTEKAVSGVVARTIPGPRDGPEVGIFIAERSSGARPRPALLYMHGGGFISGDTASSWPGFAGLKQISEDHDCVVVSVDYRLAPQTRFPGALEDNYAALKWLHANAELLGVDPTRIAIMGESAGGGHAATLAIAARDRGEIPVLFQLLIYPMLDDRTGSTRSEPPHIGAFIFTPEGNRHCWSSLLGVPAGSRIVPKGSVPARAQDLRGLPPTYIGVGALDLFVNEDIEFARRLLNAGVSTELYVAPGAYHGFFFLVPDAAVSKRFAASYNAALAKAFATSA